MHTKTLVDVFPTRRTAQYTQNFKYIIQHITANRTLTNAHDGRRHSVILNSNLFSFTSGKNLTIFELTALRNTFLQYMLVISYYTKRIYGTPENYVVGFVLATIINICL